MRLPQVAETNTPQPKDVAGEIHCMMNSWLFQPEPTSVEIRIIYLEVKDGNSFTGSS
jgi:hypothetical protein